ncbi:hypothetical protein TYRP_012986 [Tyrophagus putrescentiae]|nr:hypothetical protein TYRP_012986 [Tyrophagus putrescentiae]
MRKFDLIIFGASGFTGRWAIAVRSPAKMRAYLREMEARTGVADLEAKVPVLAADVTDLASMRRAFSQGQLVMSCIGPYSLLGEPVLRAAIDARAHYLDLSGEPLFMERVALQYDQAARDNEVFAVSSCGFDSIPSDVGTQYLKEQFSARGGGHLGTVEHYLETAFHPANRYSFASWVSLIEGFKHADQLREVRRRLFSQFGPLYRPYHYPMVQKRHRLRLDPHRGYIAPFPGSDRSVVKRTQLYRYQVLNEEPVQFEAYYCMPTWRHLLLTALMNLNLAVLSRTALGDRLLRQYAHLFSLGFFSEGTLPNHDTLPYDLFTISLGNMTAKGTLLIRGSNLAYIDTSTIAVHAALTLLEQLRCAPLKVPFGVVTPASILDPQLLIPRLNQNGVLFDYLEE